MLAGALIGFAGGVCGIGGGLLAVPLLHFVGRLELKRAVATGLVLVFATTGSATATELLQGAPNTRLLVLAGLVPGVLIGAQLGFRLAERLPQRALRAAFVLVLASASLRLFTGGSAAAAGELAGGWTTAAVSLVVGLGGGFLAPLLGVGGGLLMVPGLYLGLEGLGFAAARTASLAAGAVGSARSLRLHAAAGRVAWRPGAALGAWALVGAALAVRATRDPAWVERGRAGLALLLAYVALRFALQLLAERRAARAHA